MSGTSAIKAVAKSAFAFLCKVKSSIFSLLPDISLNLTTELLSEVLETGAQKLWDIHKGSRLLTAVSDSYDDFAESFASELLDELYKNICDDVGTKVGKANVGNMSRAVLSSFDAMTEESIKEYSAVRRLEPEEAERLTAFLIGYKQMLLKNYYKELSVNDKARIQTVAYITAQQVKRVLGKDGKDNAFSLYLPLEDCPVCGSGSIKDLGDEYVCASCGERVTKQPNIELIGSLKSEIASKIDAISVSLDSSVSEIADKMSGILSALGGDGVGSAAVNSYVSRQCQSLRDSLCRAATYDPVLRRFPDAKNVRARANELLAASSSDPLALFFAEATSGSSHVFCNMLERYDFSSLSDGERKIIALYSIYGIRSAYCEKASIDVYLQRYFSGDEYVALYGLLCEEAEKLDTDIYDPDKPRDLFVMYISEDLDVVRTVVGELESLGVSCFYSERNVRHVDRAETHDYNETLHRAMIACRAFLLISTEAARAADGRGHIDEMRWWMRRELDAEGESDYLLVKSKKPRFELVIGNRKSKRCAVLDAFFRGFNNLGVTAETIATQLLSTDKASETANKALQSDASLSSTATAQSRKNALPDVGSKQSNRESKRISRTAPTTSIRDEQGLLAFTSAGNGQLAATIIKGSEEIYIPSSFNGFSVTEIRAGDGIDFRVVKAITIPESVSNIDGLFQLNTPSGRMPRFPSLTKITLLNKPQAIDDYAFAGYAKLKEISGLENVGYIGSFAFFGCVSIKINFSELTSLRSIGASAFEGCTALRQPHFPEGLESIGARAFKDCSGFRLASLSVHLKSIGDYAFMGCTALANLTVRTELESIGEGAFRDCVALTKIVLPLSLKQVGDNAFYGCSSLFIYCEASEIPIGFSRHWNSSGCPYKLGEVQVGKLRCSTSLLQDTANAILESCNDTRLIVPDAYLGKPVVRVYVPQGTAPMMCVEEIHLPDTITTIQGLFSNFEINGLKRIPVFPNLKRVFMGNGITSLDGTFWGCASITSITLPAGLLKIGANTFSGCSSLEQIIIPDGVSVIGEYAFSDCRSLKKITLPKGLERIEDGAFINCSQLTEIIIPDGVTYIGENAFVSCHSLTRVHIPRSVKTIKRDAFGGKRSKLTVTCEAPKKPFGWSGKWIGVGATVYFDSDGV